jgi:hypothetical protein
MMFKHRDVPVVAEGVSTVNRDIDFKLLSLRFGHPSEHSHLEGDLFAKTKRFAASEPCFRAFFGPCLP